MPVALVVTLISGEKMWIQEQSEGSFLYTVCKERKKGRKETGLKDGGEMLSLYNSIK